MVDLVLDRWQRTPADAGPGSAGDPAGIPRVRPRSGQPAVYGNGVDIDSAHGANSDTVPTGDAAIK